MITRFLPQAVRQLLLFLTLLTLTGALVSSASASVQSNWWVFRNNPQHTGCSAFPGPASSALKWTYATGNHIFSSPAIGANGTIYAGSEDHYLYAFNPLNGSLKWKYLTGNQINSSPAIGADGTIYVGSDDQNFYALTDHGTYCTLKWVYVTGEQVTSSPTIGADGTIYVGSSDKNLYAFTDHGTSCTLKWRYTIGDHITSSPALGPDGTIYIGSNNKNIYALTDHGSSCLLKWQYATGNQVTSSPAIGADGTIYIGSEDHNLYALSDHGTYCTQKWHYATGQKIDSSPAIGADGTIYIGSDDRNFYSLTDHGTECTQKWHFTTGDQINSSATIGADGTIYFGSQDDNFYALSDNGTSCTLKWQYTTKGHVDSSPAIGADGTIYFGSDDKNFYALNGVLKAPTITSFTPTSGGAGSVVTISGTNLSNASAVTVGGTAAAITSDCATSMTITVGSGTNGTIVVTTLGGTATSSGVYTFLPTYNSTGTVPANPLWTNTGIIVTSADTITISGATGNWTWGDGDWSGPAGCGIVGDTDDWIVNAQKAELIGYVMPTNADLNVIPRVISQNDTGLFAVGTDTITLTGIQGVLWFGFNDDYESNAYGDNAGSVQVNVSITCVQSPAITSFTPTSGPTGTVVTISGTNLSYASAVTVGGTIAAITSDSDTSLTITVGSGATGKIVVTSIGGTATSSSNFICIGPAAKLAFHVQPNTTVATAVMSPAVTVQVQDANGNLVTSATNAVTLAIGTNPGSSTLNGTLTVTAVNGVATFNTLTLNKTGTGYTLTAAASGLTGATSSTFNITVGIAAKLAFQVQPSTAAADAVMSPAVKVQVQDANGNLVTSATNAVTLAIGTNPGSSTLGGTLTVTVVSGVATFSNLTLNKTGTGYTLTAAAIGLTSVASSTFNITVGAAAKLAFQVQPSTTAAGAVMSPAVTVQVQDANSNLVTTATNAVTLAIGTNPGSSTLGGMLTVTAVNGVATFSTLTLNKTGTGYTLTAAATGLTSATSSTFNITVGIAAKLAFQVQPSTAAAGAVIAPAVTVQVQDANGNLVTTATNSITPAIGTNPGSSTLGGTLTVNAISGVATFSTLTLNKTGIGYTLTASATGLTSATSNTFNITAGAATQLAFQVQPSTTVAGAVMTPAVTAQVQDPNGNLVTTASNSITLAIGVNPGSSTLGGTRIANAVSGVATFSTLTLNKPGTGYTLTAAGSGLPGATSSAFNITASQPIITSFTSSIGGAGTVITISGTNLANTSAVTVGGTAAAIISVSATSITITISNGATGAITINTPGGTGTSASIFSYYAPLNAVSLGATPAAPQAAGTPITLTATSTGGTDVQYKFRIYDACASPAWSELHAYSSQATCTWAPSAAGDYLLVVTARDGTTGLELMAQACYMVTALPLMTIVLATVPAAPQEAGAPITLTATATGGTNVQLLFWVYNGCASPTWTQLQIFSGQPFCGWTPSTAGNYLLVVTARDGVTGEEVIATANYLITPGPLTAVTVSKSPASPQVKDTPITFTAAATGGTDVQYQFWIYDANASPAWSELQSYSPQATCTWTPSEAGTYLLAVRALEGVTGIEVVTTLWYTITISPG